MLAREAQERGKLPRAGTVQRWPGHLPVTRDVQTDPGQSVWVGSRAAYVHILSYTQVRISIFNPPRSQALKKLTCFGSLDASLSCLDYRIPMWYAMKSSLRNTPMGALDND